MPPVRDPIGHTEFHVSNHGTKLNWLRAAVLGANDGIVSVSSVVVGVAGASSPKSFILTAGIAALVAGALSMAVGEYVSVSTQRDTEKVFLEKTREGIEIHPDELMNPWHAAYASGAAFFCGAILPIIAILISPASLQIAMTFIFGILALILTGSLSAHVGGAKKLRATLRVVFGGILAMVITFGIGKLFGVAGI